MGIYLFDSDASRAQGKTMGIKFSVGVSDGHEDRRLLEELRRKSPAGQRGRGEKKREPRLAGWPLQASSDDETALAGQSLWAW